MDIAHDQGGGNNLQEVVIHVLNPIIRGWVNYHAHGGGQQVGVFIIGSLDFGAGSGHGLPGGTQTNRDAGSRYAIFIETEAVIGSSVPTNIVSKGKIRTLSSETTFPKLVSMADIPIRRHIKIKNYPLKHCLKPNNRPSKST